MTLLKILGIDRYTAKFKEWIRNKFIAKGSLRTINNQSIEGIGNIEISGGGSSATPDWNAQKGKAGYIENRTHYVDIIRGETLKDISAASDIYADSKLKSHGYENIDGDTFMKLVYEQGSETYIDNLYIGPEFIKAIQGERIYYNYDTSYQFDYSYSYDSSTDTDIETYTSTIWINVDAMVDRLEDDEVLEYAKEKAKESIIVYDLKYVPSGKYFIKKTLEDKYLPNTVLKTTPQTLSDEDKNQALTNLGIDLVVWKYMCNPIDINPILHSVDLDGNEDILGEKYRPENYGYEVYKFKPNVCAGMFRQIYHPTKTLGELWNISYINHDEGMITFSGPGGDEIMFAVIDDGERIIWHEVDW